MCCRYESSEIALNCGVILRECVRHEPLAKIILYSDQFFNFFSYVEMSTFDVASDAFATFRVSSCQSNGIMHVCTQTGTFDQTQDTVCSVS